MTTVYNVVQGDTLTTIAAAFGFEDFRHIYDHPSNSQLREARPDPNLLAPGDEVHVGEPPEPQTHELPTDQRNEIAVPILRHMVRIHFHPHSDGPFDGLQYELVAAREHFEGVVDGAIEHRVPVSARTAKLTVHGVGEDEVSVTWTLALGNLDPIEMVSGYQARLNNMGFACGPVDGLDGPKTRAGVRAFQRHAQVSDDGIVGPTTRGKLLEAYGC